MSKVHTFKHATIRASSMIGTDVVNPKGESLGTSARSETFASLEILPLELLLSGISDVEPIANVIAWR